MTDETVIDLPEIETPEAPVIEAVTEEVLERRSKYIGYVNNLTQQIISEVFVLVTKNLALLKDAEEQNFYWIMREKEILRILFSSFDNSIVFDMARLGNLTMELSILHGSIPDVFKDSKEGSDELLKMVEALMKSYTLGYTDKGEEGEAEEV